MPTMLTGLQTSHFIDCFGLYPVGWNRITLFDQIEGENSFLARRPAQQQTSNELIEICCSASADRASRFTDCCHGISITDNKLFQTLSSPLGFCWLTTFSSPEP